MPIPLGILAVAGAGAGGGGAFDLLETTVLTTNTASVTFSSLGSYSDYKHLQIRAVAQFDDTSGALDTRLRFNSDTGTNYNSHHLKGNGSAVSSYAYTTSSQIWIDDSTSNKSVAGSYGAFVIDILDFSNTSKFTTTRTLSGVAISGDNNILLQSGAWRNTAAVTSITWSADINFTSGSRFSLYGIK